MGMNLMKIMQQVQAAQQKLGVAQEELANLEISGEAANGAVTVVMNGQEDLNQFLLNRKQSILKILLL